MIDKKMNKNTWFNAIFRNWFGLRLMIPFVLLFFNVYLGLIGLLLWAILYFKAVTKEIRGGEDDL